MFRLFHRWLLLVTDIFVSKISRGKSGLYMAMQGVTPLLGKGIKYDGTNKTSVLCKNGRYFFVKSSRFLFCQRNSGTERMSRAMIPKSGTGDFRGAAGVKTAKLCIKQDQIGRPRKRSQRRGLRVRSLEGASNCSPRGIIIKEKQILKQI